MDKQIKAESGTSNIKEVLIKTLKDKVFSNPELTEDQKIDHSYQFLVSAMSSFLANNKLQLRILMETRALEQALGKHVDQFDIALVAKPKTARVVQDIQESQATATESHVVPEEAPVSTETSTEISESVADEPVQAQN